MGRRCFIAAVPLVSTAGDENGGGGIDAILKPSAIAPIDRHGRLLLVADDKVNGLVIVDAATGARAQSEPITSRYFPPESAKWEAMARDDAGYFYVIGAHNGQSASEIAARSFLLRFKLTGGGASRAPLAIDEKSLTRYQIADALARKKLYNASDPSRNRVKIEGLAVRTVPRSDPASVEIFIGLREPDEPITVYAGAVAVASPTAGPVPPGAQPLIAPDFSPAPA